MKRSCKVEDRQPECKNKRKRLRRKENRKNRDENRSRHDLNENLVGKGTHDNPSSHTPKNMTDEIEVIVIDDEDVKVIDNDEGGEKTVVDAEPCEEERAGLRQLERVRVWRLTGLGEALASNNTRPGPADTRLRVLSYNLLAPVYATRHPELYRGVAASTLAWPRRWAGIQREVVAHQPDLLALQEVCCVLHRIQLHCTACRCKWLSQTSTPRTCCPGWSRGATVGLPCAALAGRRTGAQYSGGGRPGGPRRCRR